MQINVEQKQHMLFFICIFLYEEWQFIHSFDALNDNQYESKLLTGGEVLIACNDFITVIPLSVICIYL